MALGTGLNYPMTQYKPVPLPGGVIDGEIGEALLTQGVYDVSSTQNYMLGTMFKSKTGKKFRYNLNGSVILGASGSTGLLTQAPADDTHFVTQTQTYNYVNAVKGSYEIAVDIATGSTAVENSLAGGRLVVVSGALPGFGDAYEIVASKIDATDTCMHLLLATALRTSFAATTVISLYANPYSKVVVWPHGSTLKKLTGFTVAPSPYSAVGVVPAANYFWGQTAGETPVLVDSTNPAAGIPIMPSAATDGAVADANYATTGTTGVTTLGVPIIGTMRNIGASGYVGLADICID